MIGEAEPAHELEQPTAEPPEVQLHQLLAEVTLKPLSPFAALVAAAVIPA